MLLKKQYKSINKTVSRFKYLLKKILLHIKGSKTWERKENAKRSYLYGTTCIH